MLFKDITFSALFCVFLSLINLMHMCHYH